MHIHSGVLTALHVFGLVVLVGIGWRMVAGWLAGTPFGKAMAFAY